MVPVIYIAVRVVSFIDCHIVFVFPQSGDSTGYHVFYGRFLIDICIILVDAVQYVVVQAVHAPDMKHIFDFGCIKSVTKKIQESDTCFGKVIDKIIKVCNARFIIETHLNI